jgi:signal transduction histidine kinase
VLLVVGLAAGAVFSVGQRGAMQRQLAERLAQHAAGLVGESLTDPRSMARRLDQLHGDLGIDAAVWDAAGRRVAAAGAELAPLAPANVARALGGTTVVRGGPQWLVATPLRDPVGASLGAFVLVGGPRRFPSPAPWRALAGLGAVLVVVALAAAPLARRVSRPVERLTAAARRLGGGDLGARVDLGAAPAASRGCWPWRSRPVAELSELTLAFNDMAERVERLVRGQTELLANVSHELRSPLARIRVALALLPRDDATEARLRDLEGDLSELDRLIEDLLTTVRLEADGARVRRIPVEVAPLFGELVARAASDPALAGRPVSVHDPGALVVVADPVLLRRALWNLLENAAKYGASPIVLGARATETAVELSVEDAGEGIPPGERLRVLDPFYRLDRARTPTQPGESPRGFGLGLTVARRVAEAHGGRIVIGPAAVVDGQERGCRVSLTVPLVNAPDLAVP